MDGSSRSDLKFLILPIAPHLVPPLARCLRLSRRLAERVWKWPTFFVAKPLRTCGITARCALVAAEAGVFRHPGLPYRRHGRARPSLRRTAGIARSRTIRAATGIVPSARPWPAPSGWSSAQAELLPIPYFHVVFTLPAEIAALALQNKRLLYGMLFEAASQTLMEVAANPRHLGGGEIGLLAVLHTWGQNLMHHPHLHCVVSGGGLSRDGSRWIASRPHYFLPVRVLSRVFRNKFRALLHKAFQRGELDVLRRTRSTGRPERLSSVFSRPRRSGSGWFTPSGRSLVLHNADLRYRRRNPGFAGSRRPMTDLAQRRFSRRQQE